MKTIKLDVEPTSRTDLLCVRCGGFRTEYEVRGSDHVGVHTRCLRERPTRTERALEEVRRELGEEAPKARRRPPSPVMSGGVEVTSLAEGAFPTPRHTAAISADGTMAVTDEYGEPVPFEVRPITFEVDPFDLTD